MKHVARMPIPVSFDNQMILLLFEKATYNVA